MVNSRKALIYRLLIILVSMGILVLICIYFIEAIKSVNYRVYNSYDNKTTHSIWDEQYTYEDWGVTFYLSEIKPTTFETQNDFLILELVDVNLPIDSYQEDTFDPSLCLNSVYYQDVYVTDNDINSAGHNRKWDFSGVCPFIVTLEDYYGPGSQYYLLQGKEGVAPLSDEINSTIIRASTMYPFDEIEITFLTKLNVNKRTNSKNLQAIDLAPSVIMDLYTPTWQPNIQFSRTEYQGQDYTLVQLKLIRPLAYRIITIVIFGVIFFMIGLSLFISEIGSVVEIYVGILFSLWGVKSSLSPDYLSSTFTMIDGLVWASYIFLAYILLNRFLFKPIFMKLSKQTSNVTQFPKTANLRVLSEELNNVNDIETLSNWKLQESMHKNRRGALNLIDKRISQIKNQNA